MSKPVVYYLDEDINLAKIMEQRFVNLECEVQTFTTVDRFYEAFEQKKSDLLVLDVKLGDKMAGFEVIDRVRQSYSSNIPIFVLTELADVEFVMRGLDLGANEYIIKPPFRIDFEEILSYYIRTPELPVAGSMNFQAVSPKKRGAKLHWKMEIFEVNSNGFTVSSTHLIKKGASFYIKGLDLKKVLPDCDGVFVQVVANNVLPELGKYRLSLEVDASQEKVLEGIKKFLDQKYQEKKQVMK